MPMLWTRWKIFLTESHTFINCKSHNKLHQAFWDAAAQSDLPKALQYLAEGAAVDYKHPGHHSQTPLHKAVEANDDVVVEFLLQWFADVNQTDGNGWTALHYAAASNNVRLVLSLLRRHAKADAQDNDGKVSSKYLLIRG